MMTILDQSLANNTKEYLEIDIAGYKIPCFIVHGKNKGKNILITAQIHSGEHTGTAAIIKILQSLKSNQVSGNLICFPCVNISGFWHNTIDVVYEDNGNLNKVFPGSDKGLSTAIARYFVNEIFPYVDFVLDLHAGSYNEILTPCLFYPTNPKVKEKSLAIATNLSIEYLLPSSSKVGLLSYAANVMGIPGLLLERGYGGICKREWIEDYTRDLRLALKALGAIRTEDKIDIERSIFQEVIYVSASVDGLWYPNIEVDQIISKGSILGHLEDFEGKILKEYLSICDGIVLYYRHSLNAKKDTNLVAYGVRDSCYKS